MKKILVLLFISVGIAAHEQPWSGDKMIVKNAISIRGNSILNITKDSTLTLSDDSKLAIVKTLKAYMAHHGGADDNNYTRSISYTSQTSRPSRTDLSDLTVVIDSTATGLGNLNNKSDAGKPVSTAQAAAIALKLNTSAVTTHTAKDSSLTNVSTTEYADKAVQNGKLDIINNHPLQINALGGVLKISPTKDAIPGYNAYSIAVVAKDTIYGRNSYYRINGSWVLAGSAGGVATIFYKNVAAMLAAAPPADNTVVQTADFDKVDSGGGALYRYFASSAITANGMTVFGTTGRYKLLVQNKLATTKQLGIFGSSDNTMQMNTAVGLSVGKFALMVSKNSTLLIDPSAGGIVALNNMNLLGEDSATSILKAKVYSGSNVGGIINYVSVSTPVSNITIHNIKFDGSQTFSNYVFAGGNPIPDTGSRAIYIIDLSAAQGAFTSNNVNINGCVFKNGFTEAAVHLFNIKNVNISNNYYDSIGGVCNFLVTSQTFVTNNIAHHFGMRDEYDGGGAIHGTANLRFGENFVTPSGPNFYINDNWIYNDAQTRWYWIEARMWGYCEVNRNHLFTLGKNCFGASLGNDFVNRLYFYLNGTANNNVYDTVAYDHHTASDSVGGQSKYVTSNLWEVGGMENFTFNNNFFSGEHWTFARHMSNISGNNNTHYSPHSDPTVEPGIAILYHVGVCCQVSGVYDTIQNVNFTNENIIMGSGEILETTLHAAWINGFNVSGNINFSGTGLGLNYHMPKSGLNSLGLGITNSVISGTYTPFIYTADTLGTAKFNFAGNTCTAANFDSTLFYTPNSGTKKINLIRNGTTFKRRYHSSVLQKKIIRNGYSVPCRNGIIQPDSAAIGGLVSWGCITGTLSSQKNLNTALGLRAILASPTFTGTPNLPTGAVAVTQTAGNSTTALATTAFVTTGDNLLNLVLQKLQAF